MADTAWNWVYGLGISYSQISSSENRWIHPYRDSILHY